MLSGFLGLFGRAKEVERLDAALARAGLAPAAVPEAVKLAALKLLGPAVTEERRERSARLLAYCILGGRDFAAAESGAAAAEEEARLLRALEAPEGDDARLVMLTLAAKIAHPEIAERFELE